MLTGRPQSRGIALVAVLWVVSLLALMAAGVGSSGRVSGKIAFNTVENAKAKALAEAGVNRAAFRLFRGDVFRGAQRIDGAANLSFALPDGIVAVQVRDEDGKIDVNAAPLELIEGLLTSVGVRDGASARALAERIVDYRDEDSDPLPDGAEDPAYAAAGLVRGAADRPFRHLDELQSVLGMSDALVARIRPHLTIYADAEGFDFLRASAAALAALPGVTPEALALIRSASLDDDVFALMPEDQIGALEDYLLASRELIYEVRALASTREGGRFLLESVIAIDGGRGDMPFTTYQWRRGRLAENDPLTSMLQRLTEPSASIAGGGG